MYQYTAPSTVLLALCQRFQVAGSIRVKGFKNGNPLSHSHICTVSMRTVPQSLCITLSQDYPTVKDMMQSLPSLTTDAPEAQYSSPAPPQSQAPKLPNSILTTSIDGSDYLNKLLATGTHNSHPISDEPSQKS